MPHVQSLDTYTHLQSRSPAFNGFPPVYEIARASSSPSRIRWSKYSRCQKLPFLRNARFAICAEYDFQLCRMEANPNGAWGCRTACRWFGIKHQAKSRYRTPSNARNVVATISAISGRARKHAPRPWSKYRSSFLVLLLPESFASRISASILRSASCGKESAKRNVTK